MHRALFLIVVALIVSGVAAAQQRYGKADRRDAVFLRFPEMSQRYWENAETNAASHKVVAVPMPKQCAFVYADSYSRGQMSDSEVQQLAVSNCNRKLQELGQHQRAEVVVTELGRLALEGVDQALVGAVPGCRPPPPRGQHGRGRPPPACRPGS